MSGSGNLTAEPRLGSGSGTAESLEEFRRRYIEELRSQRRGSPSCGGGPHGTLNLVYSARDTEHNDAVVLAEICAAIAEGWEASVKVRKASASNRARERLRPC